jgi:pimeloyl-ACP methyl ester carboxylesterase
MIGQMVSAQYPTRVTGFVSMMSSSGAAHLEIGSGPVLSPPGPGATREQLIEFGLLNWRIDGGNNDETFNEAYARQRLEKDFNRSRDRNGEERQILAVIASGDRSDMLKTIKAPTLVVHGTVDPFFSLAHAESTASLIPKARLSVIEGMGHSLEPVLIPQLTEAILGHFRLNKTCEITR